MKRQIFWLLCLLSATQISYAQTGPANNYLKIGERVPDLFLGKMVYYSGPEKKLSDFKGKLLILDFWATWCAPCITAFPKNDKLRARFSSKLQILPITDEAATKALPMLNSIRKNENTGVLFSIVEDQQFRKLFNFGTIPQYVWMSPDGKFIGQTTGEKVTAENIQAVLEGDFRVIEHGYNPIVRKPNPSGQLFKISASTLDNGVQTLTQLQDIEVALSSVMTRHVEGLSPSSDYREKNRFTSINQTIENLFEGIFAKLNNLGATAHTMLSTGSRTQWEIEDPALDILKNGSDTINQVGYKNWAKKFTHCFEFIGQKGIEQRDVYSSALNDVNRFFEKLYGISASYEKRRVKCLVLERTSKTDKLTAEKTNNLVTENRYGFHIKNEPFSTFLRKFTVFLQMYPLPIVDETGFDEKKLVDMDIDAKLTDPWLVSKELEKYDLRFREDYREINVIVIKQVSKDRLAKL